MPRLSVWFIRMALLYLLAGFTFGALLLTHKGVPYEPQLWRWRPAHIELLLVGWMLQLAMGVAYWILPRFQQQRGNAVAAWAAFWLLNAGVVLAIVAVLLPAHGWSAALGRLFDAGAAAAFAANAWPRIKPTGA
jgi:cbb3-type cytochrome oxidase subunit 1